MAGNLTAMIASIFSGGVSTDPYFNLTTLLLSTTATNGQQNNTFQDSSTNNFTITRNPATGPNAPTQGTFSPFSQTGWGNYFDGTGDYLVAPSTANAAFAWGTGDYSIECWVYPIAAAYTRVFTSSVTANGSCDISSGGAVNYFDGTAYTIGTLSINQWTHLCITRKSGTLRTFKNGVMQYNGANSVNASSNANFGIAATAAGAQTGNLYIASVRMVKGGIPTAYDTSSTTNGTQIFTPPTSAFTGSESLTAGSVSLITCQSNRFIDNSSNNFTITRNGDTSVVPFSPFNPTSAWSASTVGGSGYFDGTGDYLTVANNAAFNFGTGDFTVEFWFYALAPAANSRFLSNAAYNASGIDISWESGSTRIAWYISSTPYVIPLPDRYAWHHVAFTRSGTTLNTYINGARANTYTNSSNITSANALGIGAESGGTNVTNSYISNLRLVKGTALYTGATYTVPTAPLTAITNTSLLLNFTNSGIYDATAKNVLETVGNAQVSTTQSKWSPTSMYFDGTGDYLLIPDNPSQRIGTGNFTVECWVYRNASGTYGLIGKGTGTTGWLLSLNSSNQVVFTYGSSTITSTGTISATTWTHIAVVRSGTGTNLTKIYISGTNDGTGTVSTDFNQTNAMYVAADRTGGSNANAYVQDARVTRYARYTANFSVPTAAFPVQ